MKDNQKNLLKQLLSFGIVGGVCFLIDYGLMILLTDVGHLYYLLSAFISFTVSCIVNYLLSMKFVFVRKENLKRTTEFVIFVVFSVLGLGLNTLIMWFGVNICHGNYKLIKIISTAVVMVFNFVTKKLTLSKK